MSLHLQFVHPCSKVRNLRQTRLEDGFPVWLFLHNGGMGQKCGSQKIKKRIGKKNSGSKPVLLVKGPDSKWWSPLLSVTAAPDPSGRSGLCQP